MTQTVTRPRVDRPIAGDAAVREQSRARYPDETGFIDRHGVRSFWEAYGEGEPAILFAPTWSIVPSRIWKAQIFDFARRHRVITLDPRGNGRSDRPPDARAYTERELANDMLAVMDATGTDRAVIVSMSRGAQRSLVLAAEHPDRVIGLVFIGPSVPFGMGVPGRDRPFDERLPVHDGWAKYNRHYWRRDYRSFLDFFFGQCFNEPHSTKQVEDAIGWGLETDPDTLILTNDAVPMAEAALQALCGRIRSPSLVVQGNADAVTGPARGSALADAIPGARLVTIAGGGHFPNVRDPIQVNLLIRAFIAQARTGR